MNPALHYVDSYGAFMEWRTKEMSRREFEYGDPAGYRGMQQRKRERKKRRPGSRRMRQKRRKRILRAATNTIDKIAVFETAGWRCAICGRHTPPSAKGKEQPDSPTLDHIVPFSRGGTHTLDNVQLACGGCNSSKDHGPQHEVSAQTQGEAARRGLTMREYLRLVGRRW